MTHTQKKKKKNLTKEKGQAMLKKYKILYHQLQLYISLLF
jgi:hypothetical protein